MRFVCVLVFDVIMIVCIDVLLSVCLMLVICVLCVWVSVFVDGVCWLIMYVSFVFGWCVRFVVWILLMWFVLNKVNLIILFFGGLCCFVDVFSDLLVCCVCS